FHLLVSELCLVENEQTGALLLLYMDDFCIAVPTQADIQKAYNLLKDHFSVKELGPVHKFLGFTILHNRPQHQIFLTHALCWKLWFRLQSVACYWAMRP